MTHELVPVTSAIRPQSQWLVDQLPAVLGEDELLRRFLGIFEEILDTMSQRIDGFDHYVDLSLAPIEFVRWIGTWLGLEVLPTLEPARQRDLVRKFGPLFGWRGTAKGLERLLEAVTGERASVTDSGGVFGEHEVPVPTRHVKVELTGAGGLGDEQVAAVVDAAVPADVTYGLTIDGRHVPPPAAHPAPRLEKAPTAREEALMGFATGERPLLDDAILPTEDGNPDDEGET